MDGVHLRDLGSTRKEYTIYVKEIYDFVSVTRVKSRTPMRRSPLKGKKFAEFESENYSKTQNPANDWSY